MSRLTKGTWVLVADGEKALIFENVGEAEFPHFRVRRKEEQENPPDREQATDRPGRMRDHTGPQPETGAMQRSGLEETDFHRLQKERFADEISDLLYRYGHRHKFDQLVLVAAPQLLGALRGKLHREVSGKVVAEIGKTLTHHRVDQIEKAVAAALADPDLPDEA